MRRSVEAGGGSGGGIWVETHTLDGDGSIDASGGAGYDGTDSYHGGGGGGGRVAIYYQWNHYVGQCTCAVAQLVLVSNTGPMC